MCLLAVAAVSVSGEGPTSFRRRMYGWHSLSSLWPWLVGPSFNRLHLRLSLMLGGPSICTWWFATLDTALRQIHDQTRADPRARGHPVASEQECSPVLISLPTNSSKRPLTGVIPRRSTNDSPSATMVFPRLA